MCCFFNRIENIGLSNIDYRCFLVFLLILLGCNGENKIYKIDKHSDLGISLIEHPYVFEEESFEINAFFVQTDLYTNEYILNLCLKGNISRFSRNYRTFVHGFKKSSDSVKVVNIVLNNPKTYGDSLVFRKILILKKDSLFEKINFGLENKITKQRKFVLTLKNVDLHEFSK